MSSSRLNMIILGSFSLFVLGYWLINSRTGPPATNQHPESERIDTRPLRATEDAPPSAENVTHSYHIKVQQLTQKLESDPADSSAVLELARYLQDAHQLEQAINYYKRYLETDPSNLQAWLDLAQCFAQLKQWDDALHSTKTILEISPDFPPALYNLGALYANQNRYEEARAWWKKASTQQDNPDISTRATHSLLQLDKMRP